MLPWVIRSKKFNYTKFIQCFVLQIEVKITKGHWPFVQRSNFQTGSISMKWAQINWITEMIHKKYSFAYLGSQEVCESKGSKVNDPIGPLWSVAVELWPPFDQNRDILGIWNYTFSKPTWQPDSFEPSFVEIGPTWKFDPCTKGQWPFVVLACISRTKHRMDFR